MERWETLGAPPPICKILKGYYIPFSMKPALKSLLPTFPSPLITPPSPNMDLIVNSLVSGQMISVASETSGFVSPMFTVRKGDGSLRPIFNLKNLNAFVSTKLFRLLNHSKIPSFLQREDYMASIDLSQAYCHVPINKRHQRFLCFVYRETVYKWTCLPFGLASAPQAFAQLSNWVAAFLREKGL